MVELIWQEIGELMQIQGAVQLGGPEVHAKAVDFLKNRHRYMMHYEAGKITPGERLEETGMLDEWICHDEDLKRAQTEDKEGDSMSEVTDRGGGDGEESDHGTGGSWGPGGLSRWCNIIDVETDCGKGKGCAIRSIREVWKVRRQRQRPSAKG